MNHLSGFVKKVFLLLPVFLILFTVQLFSASAEETYRYVNMWPKLEQPWYFGDLQALAIDSGGNIYLVDSEKNCVMKLSSDGRFITKWGSYGSEDGQFDIPHGIAVASDGSLYVTDYGNHRVQKFTADGTFIGKFGEERLVSPSGIASAPDGSVYVADTSNNCIYKFTSDGSFVLKWGMKGILPGLFRGPRGLAVDKEGYAYVADEYNNRVQKFDQNGRFVKEWLTPDPDLDPLMGQLIQPWLNLIDSLINGSGGAGFRPNNIAINPEGKLYVTGSKGLYFFTPESLFVTQWQKDNGTSAVEGYYQWTKGIAIDSQGDVYISNRDMQKYSAGGKLVSTWKSSGSGEGEFHDPRGIAIDSDGNIYVSDYRNSRIQKFSADGKYITDWFCSDDAIAVGSDNTIFAADYSTVKKFTSSGVEVNWWNTEDLYIENFAVDTQGNVYALGDIRSNPNYSSYIQKYSFNGTRLEFIEDWLENHSSISLYDIATGPDDTVYILASDQIYKFTSGGDYISTLNVLYDDYMTGKFIHVDSEGYIYLGPIGSSHEIRKYSPDGVLITSWGSFGFEAGQMASPCDMVVGTDGRVYVLENGNNRIQVFAKGDYVPPVDEELDEYYSQPLENRSDKAIILAGGGPYSGNALWDATQLVANFAFRALTFQGYDKEDIYYLTADTDLDLDGNGVLDDVDGDATSDNLEYAITEWASDAYNVVIYITNHGGDGYFRMSGTEELLVEDLGEWIDDLQDSVPGVVTVVYDACQSGSFVSELASGTQDNRIVITSAQPDEPAYFISTGAISFSFFFWGSILNGATVYEAYLAAEKGMETYQSSEIDDNGNGIANEESADGRLAHKHLFGLGAVTAGDIPTIGTICDDQTITSGTSATIWVDNIIPSQTIQRVWAVVVPPDAGADASEPVTSLSSFDLTNVSGSKYEGSYSGFAETGTYKVTVYAMNNSGVISIPVGTEVIQTD